jgi:hypothetical protein
LREAVHIKEEQGSYVGISDVSRQSFVGSGTPFIVLTGGGPEGIFPDLKEYFRIISPEHRHRAWLRGTPKVKDVTDIGGALMKLERSKFC